jgi:hypothetical protein
MVIIHLLLMTVLVWTAESGSMPKKIGAKMRFQDRRITALESRYQALKEDHTNNLLKVLLGPDAIETDGVCYKTCVGDTGRGKTQWTMPERGKVSTIVDISVCGFTSPPIVTTSLAGDGNHDKVIGTGSPFHLSRNGFTINLLGDALTGYDRSGFPIFIARVNYDKWHILWIAVGNTC